jgi:amidohydrolase
MDLDALKAAACAAVDRRRDVLLRVSHEIHAHPELGYEEHHAHDVLAAVLDDEGLRPERHAHGLDTAFRADAGREGPVVSVLCEYDALPGIGHACGHNIIAAAGLGAGLALAELAGEAGGRVRIVGTPAEEGGGGKVLLLERGAFDGVEAALMVHPADVDLVRMSTLAVASIHARYEGRAAHAAAVPWEGRNALDAAILGYLNVATLRQHIRPEERVHGVVTDGGEKANIVPRRAATHWMVRSVTAAGVDALLERVLAALGAGADATGCTFAWEFSDPTLFEVRDNGPMVDAFAANAARLGRDLAVPTATTAVVASTDMGNVSYAVPSIHPMLQVAPAGVKIHTPAFAEHAVSEAGDRAVLDGAKAMAMTVLDLWQTGLLEPARAAFAAG